METVDQRELSAFNRVELRGIGRLILRQGSKQSVSVSAPEAVLAHVQTRVKGGTLIVSIRWWLGMFFKMSEVKKLEIRVVVVELAGLKVSGAGIVESREGIRVTDMDIHLSGAGEVRLELHGRKIGSRLTGAGRLVLWGEADEQEIRLSGAGSVQAEKLVTRNTRIHASGAGECRVHAAETLHASLSGAGNIRYLGNPRVQSSITGVGRIGTMEQPPP